jgi:tripartite-type tricarboxylate transporter receptor subunit TctC
MRIARRSLIALGACVAALVSAPVPAPLNAQEAYPSRLVKVILPFPAGSTLDALSRIVADALAQKWGHPVVIENISGGGGNIGTDRFARSTPDGYTLMFCPPGPLTINPFLYSDISYDPTKFVPITLLARVPNVLLVRNSLGVSSVAELIERAKANPGKLTYASQGVGSTAFLTSKLFETMAGIAMVHVPYRGAAPALNDIVAGHVDMMFDTIVTSSPLHRTGKAKIIAVASPERAAGWPDIPTVAESGLPNFRSITWFGAAAPPNTPVPLADRINKDMVEVLKRGDVAARLRALMLEPVGNSRAEAAQFFASETERWGKLIKDTGIKAQ